MSALDLFASGLGAFMLIALVAIPFAPNLGSSPEDVQKIRKELEKSQQELKQSEAELKQAKHELERGLQNRETDIAIVIDTTGSMEDPIKGLQKEISGFSLLLGQLTAKARIAIVDYEDDCLKAAGQPAVRATPLIALDPTGTAQLQGFADTLAPGDTAGCNNTDEESLGEGLANAINTLDWKAKPEHRHIVLIGDNLPYSRDIEQTKALTRAWSANGSTLTAMYTPSRHVPPSSTVAAYYQEMAQLGKGEFLPSNSSITLAILSTMVK